MYCKRCGKQIADNAKFCPFCGSSIQQNKKQKKQKKNSLIYIFLISGGLVIVVVVAFVFFYSHGLKGKRYQTCIDKGDRYIDDFDYEKARDIYRKAINIDEKKTDAYIKLSGLFLETGDIKEASDILTKYPLEQATDSEKAEIEEGQQKIEDISDNGYQPADDNDRLFQLIKNTIGYGYCGNKDYPTLLHKSGANYRPEVVIPDIKGFIFANMYDYDLDGKLEIMCFTLESNTDSTFMNGTIHILENIDNKWKECVSEPAINPSSALLPDEGNINIFAKKYEDKVLIFIEDTSKSVLLSSNKRYWALGACTYEAERLNWLKTDLRLQSEETMENYLHLDPNTIVVQYPDAKKDVENFVGEFNQFEFNVDEIGYPNAIMETDKSVIKLCRIDCRLTTIYDDTLAWIQSDSKEMEGYNIHLYDYTVSGKKEQEGKEVNQISREEIGERVAAHYTDSISSDDEGTYVVLDNETTETDSEYIFLLRYQLSDEAAQKIIAQGGTLNANTLAGTVRVNKESGEVIFDGGGESVWYIGEAEE